MSTLSTLTGKMHISMASRFARALDTIITLTERDDIDDFNIIHNLSEDQLDALRMTAPQVFNDIYFDRGFAGLDQGSIRSLYWRGDPRCITLRDALQRINLYDAGYSYTYIAQDQGVTHPAVWLWFGRHFYFDTDQSNPQKDLFKTTGRSRASSV